MSARSELAVLIETEARLDRELAAAREHGERLRRAARERAAAAAAALDDELARERARITTELAAAADVVERATVEQARAEVARFEAVRGERLERVARRLAERLVEEVLR
jgi:hypothetical protein